MHNSPFQIEPTVSQFIDDAGRVERVVTNFRSFLRRRWNTDLPVEKAFSLFPLVGEREFTAAWGREFTGLINLVRQQLVDELKANLDGTLQALLGNQRVDKRRLQWELERPLGPAICRSDVVILPTGGAKVLELNLGPGFAGMFWCEQLKGLYRTEPRFAEIFSAAKVEFTSPYELFAKLLARYGAKTIAVLETGLPYMFSQATAEYLNRYRVSGRTLSVGTYELEPQANALEVDGCRIDVVFPNVLPGYFPNDFLSAVWKAEEQGHVEVLGQHLDVLFGAKSALAYVYQKAQRGEISKTDSALVEKFLPSSFLLQDGRVGWKGQTMDAQTLCHNEQNSLVLKLAVGEQANGLAIGKELSKEEWRGKLAAALANPEQRWVVQEYASHPVARNFYYSETAKKAEEFSGPYHVCPFVFDDEVCYGIRLGVDSRQTGPLVAPEDGSCSINLIGVRG